MRRDSIQRQLLRLPALLILPVTYGLIKLFQANPAMVDYVYAAKFYPFISRVIEGVFGRFPFSVFEISAYVILGVVAVMLVIRVLSLILLRKESLVRLISFIITSAITASFLVFAFYALWGFNFYRTPIDKTLNLPNREYSDEELYTLCVKLAEDASKLREGLEEDADGVFAISDRKAYFESVRAAYDAYGSTHELYKNKAAAIKPFGFSKLQSKLKILGFYICYTAEPNVNTDQPSLYLGFSAAHESAHYLGWARENEASFIAYMVCGRATNKAVAYSVTMNALTDCAAKLSEADKQLAERLYELYSPAMLRDLKAYSDYYAVYQDSSAGNIAEQINNSYLTFNGQNGTDSYGEDVELLLRYFDALGLFI